jgi:hypothetical protein
MRLMREGARRGKARLKIGGNVLTSRGATGPNVDTLEDIAGQAGKSSAKRLLPVVAPGKLLLARAAPRVATRHA